MQFKMSNFMTEKTRLKDFSETAEILNGSLKITGLLGCSVWAKVSCFWWMTK